MHFANRTRAPLLRFYRQLNEVPEPGRMPIVRMVGRNLQIIQEDFVELLRTLPKWVEEGQRASQLRDGDGLRSLCVQDAVYDVALLLLLHCAAAFDRRIVQPLSRRLSSLSSIVPPK